MAYNKIKVKRGLFSTLPSFFDDGEFGWANDVHRLYIGDGTSKHEVLMKEAYSNTSFLYATSAGNPESKTPVEVLGILSGKATADFSINNKKITNLADPVNPQDAVNLRSMQVSQSGLSPKDEVRVATITAGTLSTDFVVGSVIDGITLALGDRILIKNQSDASENGIYTANSSGAPTRAVDFNDNTDVASGAYMFVQEGTSLHDTGWVLSTDGTIVIGTTNLNFVQFSRAGQLVAGDGIDISGNTVKVTTDVLRDADFTAANSILKTDAAGTPLDFVVDINSTVGRLASGAISNIPTVSDLSGSFSNYNSLAYAKAVKDYVDTQVAGKDTFLELNDTPSAYVAYDFLRVNSAGNKVEFVSFDTSVTGTQNEDHNAISTGAFFDHNNTDTGVHGALNGANLLNSGSLIDCGTF